jgi:uncharacterized protein YndB with AHSA1/START domain
MRKFSHLVPARRPRAPSRPLVVSCRQKLSASACIDAPVERVWTVLSDLPAIQHWVGAIRHSHCPGQQRGVGALRVCELKHAHVEETIVEWDEGRSFRYRGVGAPMLASATNLWQVESHGNQTLVTTIAEATLKGGVFGKVLESLAKPKFLRLGAQSLASLKYYVEHGAPFGGRARDLKPAPIAC